MLSKTNKFLSFFIMVMVALGITASLPAKSPQEAAAAKEEKIPVKVVKVVRADVSSNLKTTGTVEAYLNAAVAAQIGGEVVAVHVEEGSLVKKNAPLLKIDDYILKLQKDRAEANYIGMKSGYEYVKQIAVLEVETRLKQAESAAASAKAQYEYVKHIAKTALEAKLSQAKANRDIASARFKQLQTGAREEEREQALAAKNSAKSNYDNALKNFERIETLLKSDAVSNQQYDDAKNRKETALARWRTASEAWNLIEKGAREEDIDAAEANLEQAEAAYKLVNKEYESKGWEKDIAMAQSAWEQAEANVVLMSKQLESRAYEADIRQAEARYKDSQANLKILKRQVDQTLLKAPFSGIAYGRKVEIGETVPPGQPLINVMRTDKVKISASISETSAALLSKGQKVEVKVDAYPRKTFAGEIIELSPAIDRISRTMAMKVEIVNQDNLLKPGMFARLNIETEKREQVLVIPKDALIDKDNRRFVYRIEKNKAVRKDVELGLATKDHWEVSSGLNEGDVVVFIGQSNLDDGKAVTIVN